MGHYRTESGCIGCLPCFGRATLHFARPLEFRVGLMFVLDLFSPALHYLVKFMVPFLRLFGGGF